MPPITSVMPTAIVATSPTRTRTVDRRRRNLPFFHAFVLPVLAATLAVERQSVANASNRLDD
jgi:hypothetical protein